MCTLGFQGKGYSVAFIKNYRKIFDSLMKDPTTPIQVTTKLDDICRVCPHQRAEDKCDKQDLIEKLDEAYQTLLGLEEEQVLSWQDAKALIKERVSVEKFQESCDGCSWKEYGVCEAALLKLKTAS